MRRKTHEEFVGEVYNLVNDEYSVVGQYVKNSIKVSIRHNLCDHVYDILPTNFLSGQRCKKCSNRKYDRDTDSFKIELFELVGEEYTILGEYIRADEKIKMKHNLCGYVYDVTPSKFINTGRRCPKCANNMKLDTEEIKRRIGDCSNDEYELVGEYVNQKTKINIRHNICDKTFDMLPNNFIFHGHRCPYCSNTNLRRDTEYFKEELFNLVGDEYVLLDEYTGVFDKVRFLHNICNQIYYATPHGILRGKRCHYCAGNKHLTNDEFFEKVDALVGSEYFFHDEYINSITKLKVTHTLCGHTYYSTPANFIAGRRCPKCKLRESNGEKIIDNYLKDNNISYDRQHTFDDCRGIKRPLPFDFAVFDSHQNLKLLIEFDGDQHYRPVPMFGGEENFREVQKRDNIKSNYCESKNIRLLRIRQYEIKNIPSILDAALGNDA